MLARTSLIAPSVSASPRRIGAGCPQWPTKPLEHLEVSAYAEAGQRRIGQACMRRRVDSVRFTGAGNGRYDFSGAAGGATILIGDVKMANLTRRRSRQRLSTVSLAEVAAHAEVSTATVSRVLNNSAAVSEDVRRKVQHACQELGYVPNGAARALSSRRTMTIGAVVPTIENSGFALTVSSLQRHLNKAGYTLLLASSDYEPDAELREV